MYIVTRECTKQKRMKLFGRYLPFYRRKTTTDALKIGSFEELKEAKKAVCRDIGFNVAFLTAFDGRLWTFSNWKNVWWGRYKDEYFISKEESN